MSDLAIRADSNVVLLDEVEARAITNRIRQCVAVALVDIAKAFQGRAWEAMGYATWDEYCREEFGEHIRLPRDERQVAVAELRAAGMSTRAIASATGANRETVLKDLKVVGNQPPDDEIADAEIVEAPRVVGLDGKRYQPTRVESDEDRLEREEREAQRYRDEGRWKLNLKIGDVLFVLAEMSELPDTLDDFARGYGPPAAAMTPDDLRRVRSTIDRLIDHWSTL